MTLPLGNHLGRLLDFANGREVYGAICCAGEPVYRGGTNRLPVGRNLGRLLDFAGGREVYGTSCCLPDGMLGDSRLLGRRVDFAGGREVFAVAEPCCNEGSSSLSSSSPQRTCNCSLDGVTVGLPARLTATFVNTGGCVNIDGLSVPLVLREDEAEGICSWCGTLRITNESQFLCPGFGNTEQKLCVIFNCGTTCSEYSLTAYVVFPTTETYEDDCPNGFGFSVFAEEGCAVDPLAMTFLFPAIFGGPCFPSCHGNFTGVVTE